MSGQSPLRSRTNPSNSTVSGEGGGGGGGSVAELVMAVTAAQMAVDWATLRPRPAVAMKVLPATVTVPSRAAPALAATVEVDGCAGVARRRRS